MASIIMTINVINSDNAKNIIRTRRETGMILSALNLFMLGFLKQHPDFPRSAVFWCDGLMGVLYIRLKGGGSVKRLRGVDMLKVALAANEGRCVSILGSCSGAAKAIFTAHQIQINDHYSLESFNLGDLDCGKIALSTKVAIITLPSPMQELLALRLASIQSNSNIHFYCIGGALNMLTNPELDCPKVLQKCGLEFLFRLRTDTLRRFRRILSSFFLVLSNGAGLLKQNITVIRD